MFAHLLAECGRHSSTDACRHILSIKFVFKQCLLARGISLTNGALRPANKHLLTKTTFKGTPLHATAFEIAPYWQQGTLQR